jgi:NAD(P)-dependent dehydrogenase (short-subunit alcohol dehydrogenase family)
MDLKYDFSGKVGVVVGASRGIGKATALGLAECGADVVAAARKAEGLQALSEEINGVGGRCIAVPTNIRRTDEIDDLVKRTLDEFGRIDFLVNNAASTPGLSELVDLEEGIWDVVLNTNVKAYFLLCRSVAKEMIEQGKGSIVNISGISGLQPETKLGAYSVSKAAVMHLTRALGAELGRHNVRVNSIAPGLTRTEFARMLWEDKFNLSSFMGRCALRRVAEPEEMARPIIFLLSDHASFINAHTLVVDGGTSPFPYEKIEIT